MSAIPDTPAQEARDAGEERRGRTHGALRLLIGGALLAIAAFATVLAVVLLVPEGNTYGLATLLKHERLAQAQGRRIVLVGGSNLSFGIDSAIIEARTGCTTINMGMNGYFGVRYMFEEVTPSIREGDIVVASFEYDNFYKSVDGSPSDLLVIVKANPRALGYLTFEQQLALLGQVPFIAQQKVLRLIEETVDSVRVLTGRRSRAGAVVGEVDLRAIESVDGFDEYGDIDAHVGVQWPAGREDGVDMSALPVDPHVVSVINSYARTIRARGADMIYSWSPAERGFHQRHTAAFGDLAARMARAPDLIIPRAPEGYVFNDDLFFDTVYHLNGDARATRTNRLVDDLETALGARAQCGPGQTEPDQE